MTASSSTFPRSTDSSPAPCGTGADMTLRPDLAIIADAVPAGTRVLDIGCGDGELIAALRDKGVDARGLEIDPANATAAKIGRAHVSTPVTNAHLVCRLLLEKKKKKQQHTANHVTEH